MFESETSHQTEQNDKISMHIDDELDMNNSERSKKYNSQLEDKFSKNSRKLSISFIKLILPLFRPVS